MKHFYRNLNIILVITFLLSNTILMAIEEAPQREPYLTEEVEKAIDKGLEYLSKQQHKDGSWGQGANPVGITSIALLAFLANGHLPELGKYGDIVKKGTDYILDKGRDKLTGYIGQSMYEHGFATLFLSEIFGESKREDVQDALEDAVKFILSCQNKTGAWRYAPNSQDMDTSVSSAVIQGLRAAREAYINVPKDAMDKAGKAIKRCAIRGGGFGYAGPDGPGIARAGAGALSLMACDEYESKEVKAALEWILKRPDFDPVWWSYGAYYCVLTMYQAGGKYWDLWYPKIQKKLLKSQKKKGEFILEGRGSQDLAMDTGFSIIALSIQKGLLPLFQR